MFWYFSEFSDLTVNLNLIKKIGTINSKCPILEINWKNVPFEKIIQKMSHLWRELKIVPIETISEKKSFLGQRLKKCPFWDKNWGNYIFWDKESKNVSFGTINKRIVYFWTKIEKMSRLGQSLRKTSILGQWVKKCPIRDNNWENSLLLGQLIKKFSDLGQ